MTTGDLNPSGENTPPTTITPPAQTQSQPSQQLDLTPLMTQLAALPEQMAKAVKEAVGQPKVQTPATPKTADQGKASQGPVVTEKPATPAVPAGGTPGRKSFRDWWFS